MGSSTYAAATYLGLAADYRVCQLAAGMRLVLLYLFMHSLLANHAFEP